MPIVDEYLYYAVDMKMNSIEMTEKGREFVTKKGEDADFFVIPDLGSETAVIEQEIDTLETEKIAEIENNDASAIITKRTKYPKRSLKFSKNATKSSVNYIDYLQSAVIEFTQ